MLTCCIAHTGQFISLGLSFFTYIVEVKVNITQSCPTLCDPMDHTVLGILQARILEWVALPFSRGSSQPMDRTRVSRIAGGFFTSWATRDTHPYLDAFFFFFLPDCSKWSCKNTNQIVLLVRLNPKHQNPSQGLMTLGVLVHVCSLTVRLCTTTVALRVPATLVFYSSCSLCFFSTSGSSDLQFLWCKRLLSSPLPLLNSYFSFSFQLEYHLFTNTFPDLLCFSAGHIHRVMALCFLWLHIYCHCRGL